MGMPHILSFGSVGSDVKDLQSALNSTPPTALPRLAVDGIFGPKTQARVREFQRTMGLQSDAIVGPITWAKLLPPTDWGVVKALQEVLSSGYMILRPRNRPFGLASHLDRVASALEEYSGVSARRAPPHPNLIGAFVIDDIAEGIAVLFLLTLILMVVASMSQNKAFKEAVDARAKRLYELMQKLLQFLTASSAVSAQQIRTKVREETSKTEECKKNHPERLEPCADKIKALDDARSNLLKRLTFFETSPGTLSRKQAAEALQKAFQAYAEALAAAQACLGC
jgi:hypothetical protein